MEGCLSPSAGSTMFGKNRRPATRLLTDNKNGNNRRDFCKQNALTSDREPVSEEVGESFATAEDREEE